MFYNQLGDRMVPMVDDKGELAMYARAHEARSSAEANPMGQAFGYIIYSANIGDNLVVCGQALPGK